MMDFITHYAGLIGLLIFFVFFVVVVAWALKPANRDRFNTCARIPFAEDDTHAH